MTDFQNVKMQKLILKDDEGALTLFIDENQQNHEYDFGEGAFVDLHMLVASCFEELDEKYESVLTCGCGDAGCAGFYHFYSKIENNEILWNINYGKDLFKFEKNQYISEVREYIENLIKLCEKENVLEYFPGNQLNKEDLQKIYSPFVVENLSKNRQLPRHIIIIKPSEKWIYERDDGKKVSLKNKTLPFYDTDIFGRKYEIYFNLDDFKIWFQKINNPKTDWKKWNEQGIGYSKQIRETLPLAFDIWYQEQNIDNAKLIHIV